MLALGSHEQQLHTKLCLRFLHPPLNPCQGSHRSMDVRNTQDTHEEQAKGRPCQNSSDFCLRNRILLWDPGILKDTKPSPSLNSQTNTCKWLLLFFYKLCLSKMAGGLRENDTNLCKSQQNNCNIHFHLKSISKVVMETNMD